MKTTTTFLFFFFMSVNILAQTQRWAIQGVIQDTQAKGLPSATITLLDPKDSTLVTFGVSNPQGGFEVKNLREDELLVQISFVGYRTFSQLVKKPTGSPIFQFGTIKLEESTEELEGVTVEAIAPVTIKKDTIEYNAAAFKTQPNANVEDLLKRLPGVEVDSEGNIKAQGETVRRIMVDGKEFFANDPKLASKNLLAEAIDKIQIYDRKSDQSQFTGIDDGQREKTINLQLKDSHKRGYFGNVTAGYGTDNRYALKGNVNKFTEKSQLSLLGLSNNTNEQGFSIEDYINFNGGIQSFSSGGMVRVVVGGPGATSSIPLNTGQRMNGIMNSHAFGANLNNEFSKKTKMTGSYFFNYFDHYIQQNSDRINFFPQGNLNFNEQSRQDNMNANHRANLIVDHQIDSLNSFRSTTNLTYTQSDRATNSITRNSDSQDNTLNSGERTNLNTGDNFQFNTDFLLRHRFKKPGRTISANFNLGANQSDYEGSLYAENQFFTGTPSTEIIRQQNFQDRDALNYGTNLSYTQPIGGRKYLELVYNFRQNHNRVNQEVYDWEEENLVLNTDLSNKFNSIYTYHRPGANLSWNRQNYNLVTGVAWQATRLKGDLLLVDERIQNRFENFLPSLRFNYNFSNTKNLGFNYGTSVTEPTIEQLQPVVNNADPLNLYVGNPELKPAYLHNVRLNYNSFDMGKFISFFANANVNYTKNAIVNSQTIDENLVRTVMPVNVQDQWTANGNVNFGFPIKPLNSRFSIGPNGVYQRGLNLINGQEDEIKISNFGGNIRYDYNWEEYLMIGLSANLSRQRTGYSFNPQQNQLFFNQSYNAEATVNLLKKYTIGGNFNYLVYRSETTDFSETIPLLNLSVSRFILKNNKGEIKLSGQNLLNQNVGVSQRADVNYVEQTVTNNLGRFVLLSFTYKLGSNPMNNMPRPGGGGMRMIRMGN
jgi:hypothetical protein